MQPESVAHSVMWLEEDWLDFLCQRTETSSSIHKGLLPYRTRSEVFLSGLCACAAPLHCGKPFAYFTTDSEESLLAGYRTVDTHGARSLSEGERRSGWINDSTQPTFTQKSFHCRCKWASPHMWVRCPLRADDSLSLWLYHLQRMRQGAVCYQQGNQLILR